MAAKHRTVGTPSITQPRPLATDEPRELPDWIARLRDRVSGEGPGKREFAEKAGEFILELMDLSGIID
jgi:hypothetical protein